MQDAKGQVKEIRCVLKSLVSLDKVTKYHVPYNSYVEALLPSASEWDYIWRWVFKEGIKVK